MRYINPRYLLYLLTRGRSMRIAAVCSWCAAPATTNTSCRNCSTSPKSRSWRTRYTPRRTTSPSRSAAVSLAQSLWPSRRSTSRTLIRWNIFTFIHILVAQQLHHSRAMTTSQNRDTMSKPGRKGR